MFVFVRMRFHNHVDTQLVKHFKRAMRRIYRAGLNPMQPVQLHWAPRLWGPAPWCLGRLFIFVRYTLRLRIQQKRHINFMV